MSLQTFPLGSFQEDFHDIVFFFFKLRITNELSLKTTQNYEKGEYKAENFPL